MNRHKLVTHAVAACLFLVGSIATAGTIQLDLTGVNLTYSAGSMSLTDTGAPADPLTSIVITEDALPVPGSPLSGPGTALDLSLTGIAPMIPITGGSATSVSGGNLELFGPGGTSILDLTLDEVEVIYAPVSAPGITLNFLFTAGNGSIDTQAIPGISAPIIDPIQVSFNLNAPTVTESGGFLTGFTGSGTGVLTAEMVPEPSTIAMLGLASMLGLVYYSRYKLG